MDICEEMDIYEECNKKNDKEYSILFNKENIVFLYLSKYIASFDTIKEYIGGDLVCKRIELEKEEISKNDSEEVKEYLNCDVENNINLELEKEEISKNKTEDVKECLDDDIVRENDILLELEKEKISIKNEKDIEEDINIKKDKIDTNNKNDEKFKIEYNLILKAPYGYYSINYKESIIYIDYNISNKIVGTKRCATKYETIKLSSNTKNILLEFIEDARKYCEVPLIKKKTEYIIIRQYDVGMSRWIQLSQLTKRSLDSICLDKNQIENLKNDINKFIKSENLYNLYGIPYKRNYLLYGIPGTGKTSLIFALASYLNMSVSIFSFVPGIDDTKFMKCINSIPKDSLLVLEDIDGVFVNRAKDYNNNSMITFSGILNTLDGMGRRDKLITFMTTNFKEQLDSALLRPGRIDYKIEFTYATQYQISKMFDLFIKNNTNKKEFLNYIKLKNLTTCVLQKFLFEYRDEENIMNKINILDEYLETYNNYGKNLYS